MSSDRRRSTFAISRRQGYGRQRCYGGQVWDGKLLDIQSQIDALKTRVEELERWRKKTGE